MYTAIGVHEKNQNVLNTQYELAKCIHVMEENMGNDECGPHIL